MLVRILPDGKPQIIKDLSFCEMLDGKLPDGTVSFTDLLSEFDTLVQTEDSRVSKDALNNAHGDWYEWLIAIAAWNYTCSNSDANLLLVLPNISQFDVSTLYVTRLQKLLTDLREKVGRAAEVSLITSNPDFVILNRKLANDLIADFQNIKELNVDVINYLEGLYTYFIDKCDYSDIVGYASVKASLRPDRRLQISHEGSLMKALYAHLQTREWIINPKGIKYYAVARKISDADREGLKTVATHSLTTVFSQPQAACDAVFEINSLQQAQDVFPLILH